MATFDRSLGPYLCECERGFKLTRNGACEDCTRIEASNAGRWPAKPAYGVYGYESPVVSRGEIRAFADRAFLDTYHDR